WRSESPFTVGFRAYVGFWFHCSPNPNFEPQRYRARSPNLVTAIVLWNTVYLERATQGLVEAGKPVDGELLQYLSPLGWEHINLTGDYVWRLSRRLEDGKFRPLRMPGKP
ncbi:Tn3 family transposase, partial [Pseudomonas shirazica]|uniref:Tn3 family transposase n=1 Tax=Pseudomonas shirazica TaxID=1940636 RepID=UPI0035239127